ncbi:glycosyltransferase [Cycloclasticus pugetii]|uniref:glycosyltransferase n=1 Tax=Cycloclasticus pugetii TaxID=34068 RepID=UPI003A93856F
MKNSVLINASNLHDGGGVQVASSFISELVSIETNSFEFVIWASSEVFESLVGLDHLCFQVSIQVVNTYGLKAFVAPINGKLAEFDLVFTIFGPNYFRSSSYIDLVGFAQLWILDDSAYSALSLLDRLRTRLKFFAQKLFFMKSDAFVVELEHVRDGLYRKRIAPFDSVHVAYNCISSIYLKPATWLPLAIEIKGPKFKVGFLGRDYPHKNTAILPFVKRILAEKYDLDVEFFVTLNDLEWSRKSQEFRSSITNVGSLAVTQCPSFYRALDAVIFPSLLECFSATPLEAMAMGKPLFASNRPFVTDICGGFSFKFDPLDPEDAAGVMADYIRNRYGKDSVRLAAAREHVINFSSAKDRAERYLEIIKTELVKKQD